MKRNITICFLFGIFIVEIICEKFMVNVTVVENKGSGDNILNLKSYIRDNNLPINPNGSYDIISNEPEISNYFILQSRTGQLRQRSNIDRENICKHVDNCQKRLLVSINGHVLEILITIKDENDNVPQFAIRHKTIAIQENSNIKLELSLPTAEDSDSEKNSIARYFIKDTGKSNQFQATKYFVIVEKTMNKIKIPYLKLIKEIDREEIDRFELILVAEDTGKQQGSCTITVSVIDVNDNSPQWPNPNIYKKLRECDRQRPLLELQAYDKDDSSTPNGQIKYKISDHSPRIELINRLFHISGSSLFLSSQGLQFADMKGQILFIITAADGGGRETDVTVIIEVEDCNDHAPSIQIAKSTVSIKENDNSLITLTTVTVKDEDNGVNSEFNCDLNDTTYFLLTKEHSFNQPNGEQLTIYIIKKLADISFDREIRNFYSVLIRCEDQGRPSLTGEKLFSVSILDENDNAPKFPANEIKFSITENNFVGSPIGYIVANDPDYNDNGKVTYQIMNNEENYYFTITSFGKIETKWKFDRETKDSYSLIVMAKDHGEPSLNDTCTIVITILDVNDCVPVFKTQYFHQITESNGQTTIHANLGKVVANDLDLGENGTVYYKIRHKSSNSRAAENGLTSLKITLDGILTIYGIVDRENISSIQAEIVAYDNGKPQLSAVTIVIVDVLDVNDNKPKFKQMLGNNNYINISTDYQVGKILANLEAEDPDKGENGTINYSIISHNNVEKNLPFQLQQDGRLILIKRLTGREDILHLPERLIIRAADNGTPQRSVLVTIHVKYIANIPPPRNHMWSQGVNKKPNERPRFNNGNLDNYRDNESSDNMTMLYILAGVLFIVFIIVLLVLVYTYFSGRFSRGRQMADMTHEKVLNNYCNDGTGNYDCDLLTGNVASCQENCNKSAMSSINSPTNGKNNYTHLMRMNESKYTPIHFNSNYIQSICSDGSVPIQSNISQPNSDNHNYDQCLQKVAETSSKSPMQVVGNKWISIENINHSINGNKSSIKSQDNGFFYNAHSYAAYINQFGLDDKDPTSPSTDTIAFTKSQNKQQTLPSQPKKLSKEEQQMLTYQPILANSSSKSQPKKSYFSSSFV